MRIVIDIPDQMYQKIKETNMIISGRRSGKRFDYILFNAVNTGTPLPKGHGDLIDVNRKITVPIYDEQYEEWGEETLTVLEALNGWSDEGVTAKDVVISADKAEGSGEE